jgi:hypothetical protein
MVFGASLRPSSMKPAASTPSAEYLQERREMLQWYADPLDALRDAKPGETVLIRRVT